MSADAIECLACDTRLARLHGVWHGDSEPLPELFDAAAADRLAAAAPAVPEALYEQLAEGGHLVVPVGTVRDQWLEVVERAPEGPLHHRTVPCRFVPLLGSEGFDERRHG